MKFFTFFLRLQFSTSEIYAIGLPITGVMTFITPVEKRFKLIHLIRANPLTLAFSSFPFISFRVFRIFSKFSKLEKKYANEPYFYLTNIGITRSKQGKGLGSLLMSKLIHDAKHKNAGIYTETVTPANVTFYLRQGLELMEEYLDRKSGLTLYSFFMHR